MSSDDKLSESLTHVLINDVVSALQRMREADTPTHRREFVRAVVTAIEGLHWSLKDNLLWQSRRHLSLHEQAAMLDQSYFVDDKGKVHTQPRFLPLTTAIRLVIDVIKRLRPEYTIDLSHPGWEGLKRTIEVRNRLVHPKRLEEFSVTDAEVDAAGRAFYWFLALNIEVLHESKEYLKAVVMLAKEKSPP